MPAGIRSLAVYQSVLAPRRHSKIYGNFPRRFYLYLGRVGHWIIPQNLDFNIHSTTSYTNTANTAMDGSSTLSESVSANVNWTTWKNFTLGGDYSFSYTLNMQQQDITTTNSTLNLELGKKFLKQKQLHLRFRALDILRQHNIENYSLQDTYASTSYHTTPRNYYTISLSYRFNSMNKALRRSR